MAYQGGERDGGRGGQGMIRGHEEAQWVVPQNLVVKIRGTQRIQGDHRQLALPTADQIVRHGTLRLRGAALRSVRPLRTSSFMRSKKTM